MMYDVMVACRPSTQTDSRPGGLTTLRVQFRVLEFRNSGV